MLDECWFELNPKTGEIGDCLEDEEDIDPDAFYVDDGWQDSFHDDVWDFHEHLAHFTRPSIQELNKFLIDGVVPSSLSQLDRSVLEATIEKMKSFWESVDESYHETFQRPAHRIEKKWIAEEQIRKMSIGKRDFYAGKVRVREEWYIQDENLPQGIQDWCRLRVFDDGSADAWYERGLQGYDSERDARHSIEEGHFSTLETLRAMPDWYPNVPSPPVGSMHSPSTPFRYFGVH